MSGLMDTIRQTAKGKSAVVVEEKIEAEGVITAPSLVEEETVSDEPVSEQQIDELSKKTLGSYAKKAVKDASDARQDTLAADFRARQAAERYDRPAVRKAIDSGDASEKRADKRSVGLVTAYKKVRGLANVNATEEIEIEGEQIDELSKKTLASYVGKASQSAANLGHEIGRKRSTADDVSRFTNRNGWGHNNEFEIRDTLRKALGADNKSIDKLNDKAGTRLHGIKTAAKKLSGQAKVNAREEFEDDLDLSMFTEEELADFIRLVELDESGEQLDELSKKTLASYTKKAVTSYGKGSGLLAARIGSKNFQNMVSNTVNNRRVGIKRAVDRLAKEENEMNETVAADSLKPGARSISDPKSKFEVIQSVIGAMHAMRSDELVKWYNDTIAQVGHEADSTPNASEKNKSSVAMKPSAAKEDVEKLFAGQELSEEFKNDAATLFEAAVSARVLDETTRLEEMYEQMLSESVEEIAEALADQVEAYLDTAAEQWLEENEVAIESALRNELTEEFMTGLKNLFAEHYIDLPEERVDVVEELATRVEELEELLDSQINENIEIKRALAEAEAEAEAEEALENAMEGMNLTQRERFKVMAETVEYDGDVEEFARKLNTIKTTYFTEGRSKAVETNIVDETFEGETGSETIVSDPNINRYVQAIGRTIKR